MGRREGDPSLLYFFLLSFLLITPIFVLIYPLALASSSPPGGFKQKAGKEKTLEKVLRAFEESSPSSFSRDEAFGTIATLPLGYFNRVEYVGYAEEESGALNEFLAFAVDFVADLGVVPWTGLKVVDEETARRAAAVGEGREVAEFGKPFGAIGDDESSSMRYGKNDGIVNDEIVRKTAARGVGDFSDGGGVEDRKQYGDNDGAEDDRSIRADGRVFWAQRDVLKTDLTRRATITHEELRPGLNAVIEVVSGLRKMQTAMCSTYECPQGALVLYPQTGKQMCHVNDQYETFFAVEQLHALFALDFLLGRMGHHEQCYLAPERRIEGFHLLVSRNFGGCCLNSPGATTNSNWLSNTIMCELDLDVVRRLSKFSTASRKSLGTAVCAFVRRHTLPKTIQRTIKKYSNHVDTFCEELDVRAERLLKANEQCTDREDMY